jgi:hypothetical protein
MIYTNKIQKAIKFAAKTHNHYQQQTRKGKVIPYISHPLTVGLILSLAGASEYVIVAGILHDTIEDSTKEKKVTPEMLTERFGKNVARLVSSVTEQNKDLPWEIRKKEALAHVKHFTQESLLVKSADIISNVSEIIDDYARYKEKTFERFNAPKGKIIKNQLKVINAIVCSWGENPLAQDLISLANDFQMINAINFMSSHPAIIIKHKDYNENMNLECPICDWKGTPKKSGYINTDSHFALDVSCPICGKMLLVADYASV